MRDRLRIENRIEALLFTPGLRGRPSLRSWDRDRAARRTGDGPVPPLPRTEPDRLRCPLMLGLERIRELEAARADAWETAEADDTMVGEINRLPRIRGIGENVAAVRARAVFYRSFANRRQLAREVGITPLPTRAAAWSVIGASAERATCGRARP